MKKHFKVPKEIPFVHGDKRIKLESGHGMLLWYRRDFGSAMITLKTFEAPIKCLAARDYREPRHGCLYYLKTSEGEWGCKKDPRNYAMCLGGNYFMTWVDYKPYTFSWNGDVKYIIGEAEGNSWIKKMIDDLK